MPDEASRPLGGLGLCLSGGGYRATAFHLGTLALLERVGLLRTVSALSTVSGGTFAGAAYALSQARGGNFRDFALQTCRFLRTTDVVREALGTLEQTSRGGRSPSLIRAAADVYDQGLFGGAAFGTILDHEGHLREITFNATDLAWAYGFRFQKSQSPGALIGNKAHHIRREDAAKLRLADIAAASSCFPGAFEPMLYPDDFVGAPPGERWPLMDGGIYDNQGVAALERAEDRAGSDIDLLFVSDVDQSGREIHRPPSPSKRSCWTVRHLRVLVWSACALLLGLAVAHTVALTASLPGRVVEALHVVAITLCFALVWCLWKARRLIDSGVRLIPPDLQPLVVPTLERMRLDHLKDFVHARALSTFNLTSAVFMKCVRDLVRSRAFARAAAPRPSGTERPAPDFTVVESRITQLVPHGRLAPKEPTAGQSVGAALQLVLEAAARAPTSLWLEETEDGLDPLDVLVVSGQANACFSLIEHLAKTAPESPLIGRLLELWRQLDEVAAAVVARRGPLSPGELFGRALAGGPPPA